jgi:hypothetical protein
MSEMAVVTNRPQTRAIFATIAGRSRWAHAGADNGFHGVDGSLISANGRCIFCTLDLSSFRLTRGG